MRLFFYLLNNNFLIKSNGIIKNAKTNNATHCARFNGTTWNKSPPKFTIKKVPTKMQKPIIKNNGFLFIFRNRYISSVRTLNPLNAATIIINANRAVKFTSGFVPKIFFTDGKNNN